MEELRQRTPAAPRFEIATPATFITIFADRLRLNAYEDLGRFCVAVSADGAAREQAPVTFDLAKQDAPAFRRAVKAFNAILDEHEAKTAVRNQRRRTRQISKTAACHVGGFRVCDRSAAAKTYEGARL